MKAYFAIVKLRFAVQLQYRAAAAAAFFTNFFFGAIRVMVFHAFYASAMSLPLTLGETVTYTWLTQVTYRLQPWNGDIEIIQLIRSGNVSYELCRPLDLYFIWYSRLISLRIVPALLTGVPLFVIAHFLPGGYELMLPGSVAGGAAWAVSTFIALLLGCAISNLINVSALWTIAGDGMQRIFPAAILIFSGATVPLAFFPDWMQAALKFLPFSGLIDIPFRFYLGLIPASELVSFGLLQLGWTLGLYLARGAAAVRRHEAGGGAGWIK